MLQIPILLNYQSNKDRGENVNWDTYKKTVVCSPCCCIENPKEEKQFLSVCFKRRQESSELHIEHKRGWAGGGEIWEELGVNKIKIQSMKFQRLKM